VEKGVDSGKGSCIGSYLVVYIYSVSAYRPFHSPLPKSMHFVPRLFHHPLQIRGDVRGTHDRKEALEGDQELYQLLLISKRPLLAMRPANSGGGGGGNTGVGGEGRSLWRRCGEGGGNGGGDNTGGGGERSEGARVWTHSTTSVTEEVRAVPPSDVYRKVGNQQAWSWVPVGSRLPSPGAKRWGGPTSTTRHRPRSGSLKTRPIRSVPSRVGEGRVGDRGWGVGEGRTRRSQIGVEGSGLG
jgi:hypothetical protein